MIRSRDDRDENEAVARAIGHAILDVLRVAAEDGSLQRVLGRSAAEPFEKLPAELPSPVARPVPVRDPPVSSASPTPIFGQAVVAELPAPILTDLTRRFELVRQIDTDPSGERYLARERDGSEVIVRLFSKTLAIDGAFRRRLDGRARALLGLRHPNVLPLLASGEHEGLPYLVSRAVHGRTLAEAMVVGGRVAEADVLRLAEHVANGLQAAFAQGGVVHGGLRPADIVVEYAGLAATAPLAESESALVAGFCEPRLPWHLKDRGPALALPTYVAPEQLSAEVDDHRCDIYALGCIMFELLAGEPPFVGHAEQIIAAKSSGPDVATRLAHVSERTRTLVAMAMAPHARDRYLSLHGFIAACQRAADARTGEKVRSMRFLRRPMSVRARPDLSAEPSAQVVTESVRRVALAAAMRTPLPDNAAPTDAATVSTSTADERPRDVVSARIQHKHRERRAQGSASSPSTASDRLRRSLIRDRPLRHEGISMAALERRPAPGGKKTPLPVSSASRSRSRSLARGSLRLADIHVNRVLAVIVVIVIVIILGLIS